MKPIRVLALCALALLSLAAPAAAQDYFSNPFAGVTPERRGATSPALMRLRYELTFTQEGQATSTRELVIDVGPDWSLVHDRDRTTLHDFRMGRTFDISADGRSYASFNALGRVAFLVMERQNRDALTRFLQALPNPASAPDACDAESELGVASRARLAEADFQFAQNDGAIVFSCDGESLGGFVAGSGQTPPPALWPTIAAEMPTHPALFHRLQASGFAPQRIDSAYKLTTGGLASRSWRLVSAEASTTAYPLSAANLNETAARLTVLTAPGVGELAAAAVLGRAQGGPPTLASWGARLTQTSARDGPAAAILMQQSFNMFPELMAQCSAGGAHPVCAMLGDVRALAESDVAVGALFEIALAEQAHDPQAAFDAMLRVQSSPHANDPLIGAAFALALMQFDAPTMARAEAAGLPTDAAALQIAALRALPYNPAYWTDVGDLHGASYDWMTAFLLYDVAFSLPIAGAQTSNSSLGKRQFAQQLVDGFPDFFLPN